ncbi:hypothetical protein AVEN_147569-1, partial [Araneus ventricosus]
MPDDSPPPDAGEKLYGVRLELGIEPAYVRLA